MIRKFVDHEEEGHQINMNGGIDTPSVSLERNENREFNAFHCHRLIWREKHTANKQFKDIPEALKCANMWVYGRSLGQFVMNQALVVEWDKIWLILKYIFHEIPTTDALDLLEEANPANLFRFHNKNQSFSKILTTIVQSSTHSIATALYIRFEHSHTIHVQNK